MYMAYDRYCYRYLPIQVVPTHIQIYVMYGSRTYMSVPIPFSRSYWYFFDRYHPPNGSYKTSWGRELIGRFDRNFSNTFYLIVKSLLKYIGTKTRK